jgi:hypothetical protein
MVARHSLRFLVSGPDDLLRAEDAIDSAGDPVTIEANADSGVLLEIEDFRCLASTARAAGTAVTFSSDDPLRRELARIVGLAVEEPAPVLSGLSRAIQSNAPTRKIDRVETPTPGIANTEPVPSLSEALDDYATDTTDESYASFSFVITPPIPRRAGQFTGEWRYDAPAHQPVKRTRARRSSKTVGRAAAVAIVTALALLIASATVMAALIVPQATITLVPTTSLISADVSYGIAGQGSAFDVAIEPETITSSVSFTTSIPASGIRTEPDGTASGEILLTNPLTTEVYLPAGTVLTTSAGISFSTVEDVVIPAADPFGTLTMGSAVTTILASIPGPDGNIAPQQLAGQLDSGLFYSNRDQTSGGTLREISTVAESDLEALRILADEALSTQTGPEIASQVPEGQRMIEGSIEVGAVSLSYSHELGADATEVSIEASQPVSAQVYDPERLNEMAVDEMNRRLAGAVPRDNVLLAGTISVGDPIEIQTSSGNPEYRMSSSARIRAVLDPEVVGALKHDLVGLSQEEAEAKVVLLKGVARFDIEYGPEWFPLDWPPRLESRIAINIDDGAATTEATGETRP